MESVTEILAGDSPSAKRLLDEARAVVAELDYVHGRLAVLQARVFHGFFDTDLDAVRSAAGEGARLARDMGDLYILEVMLLNLGSAALIEGALDEAEPLFAEALRLARQIDDRVAQFHLLGGYGAHAALSGNAQRAAQLLGAAERTRVEAGANLMSFLSAQLAQAEQAATAALGAPTFETEIAEGRALSRDTAIRLAPGAAPDSVDAADTATPDQHATAPTASPSANGRPRSHNSSPKA